LIFSLKSYFNFDYTFPFKPHPLKTNILKPDFYCNLVLEDRVKCHPFEKKMTFFYLFLHMKIFYIDSCIGRERKGFGGFGDGEEVVKNVFKCILVLFSYN
jgi:hypothetical protein